MIRKFKSYSINQLYITEKLPIDLINVTLAEQDIKITASFGVCAIKPLQNSDIESFIECADKKLYSAKNNGRNRVEY